MQVRILNGRTQKKGGSGEVGWLRMRIGIKMRMKKESNNKGEERVCVCIYHTKHENNDRDRTDAQYIAYCKTNHTKVKWMKKDK